jgi:hypothetical protein
MAGLFAPRLSRAAGTQFTTAPLQLPKYAYKKQVPR